MSIFSKKSLGIDVGAASIKLVEVSSVGKRKKLENYLEFKLPPGDTSAKGFYGENLMLLSQEVAEILQALLKRTKIKQRKVALSIPDFSTFFTTFSLPPMKEEEIPRAVEFEARHHIPLPLSEVTFDWQITEKEEMLSGVKLKVLLVVVPNRVLENYQRMATLAQLTVKGIEAEVFALMRSSVPKERTQSPICLVDIGWQSTTVSIAERKHLKVSHSFDISSIGLTRALSKALNVDLEKAEALKVKYGLDPKKEDVSRVLSEKLNSLASEIEKVCQDFESKEGRKVDDLILAGGTSALFGLKEYLSSRLKKNVQIADPFSDISFPSLLKDKLRELGPTFAVAVGAGIMGTEA